MTEANDKASNLPQKRFYRQRAHSNPLSDHTFDYPTKPSTMNWIQHYPNYDEKNPIRFADIGCGYGGLLITLGEMFPEKLSIGMEIRVKVSDYVYDRINALREQHQNQKYTNIACLRSNAMKYLPNFFEKGQLESMFFLYPDPHFKKSKYKWRIVNYQLLAEYAYVVKVGGFVYTMTDVEDLHVWMASHFTDFPLFERVTENELVDDPVAVKLRDCSEEGKKVVRNKGQHFLAVFRRIEDPAMST